MTTTSQIDAAIRNFAIAAAIGDQAQRIKSGDALSALITHALSEARADGAREMRDVAAAAGYASASKTCGARPRGIRLDIETFVVRANLLNRPLRTRTVGGVGAGS